MAPEPGAEKGAKGFSTRCPEWYCYACTGCGVEATALKTVVCRADRERRGVLCDSCWLPLRERLWIVPGSLNVWGRCRDCGTWASVNDLRDVKPGNPVSGVCVGCAGSG